MPRGEWSLLKYSKLSICQSNVSLPRDLHLPTLTDKLPICLVRINMKYKIAFNQTLMSAFCVVGAVVVTSVVFRFPGLIEMKLGGDGGQVTVDGR